jgi:AcrR family transcriptional regulator
MGTTSDSRAVRQRRSQSSGAPVGRPRKLAAEAILQAAQDIIDEQGTDKLSIRALAKRLEVQANAIYTHFDNLDAIEEAVVEKLLNQIPMPDASSKVPLRDQLIDHFVALRAALVLHPEVTTGRVGTPAWLGNARHLDCALAQLTARGVDLSVAQVAYSALSGVTLMSAAQENAHRRADGASDLRKGLAAIKSIQANHLLQLMNLPVMKLPAEQRFRQLVSTLIDQLLPASVAKGGPGR